MYLIFCRGCLKTKWNTDSNIPSPATFAFWKIPRVRLLDCRAVIVCLRRPSGITTIIGTRLQVEAAWDERARDVNQLLVVGALTRYRSQIESFRSGTSQSVSVPPWGKKLALFSGRAWSRITR